MKRWMVRVVGIVAVGILAVVLYLTHSRTVGSGAVTAASFSPAPTAADPGPASALPELPAGAIALDLKYRGQTGAQDDIEYRSFWGFGGGDATEDPFIKEVQKRTTALSYVYNSMLTGRQWAAVEHEGRKVVALYFDLNADGKLADNERIPPTRKADDRSIEFITPDFPLKTKDGRELQFRVLLRAGFYGNNSELNCMWSPACVLEGEATIEGKRTRMVLFADGFGATFDHFGSSSCGLLVGDMRPERSTYFPRETLSSLVRCDGHFYRLKFEGQSGMGHVARAVLTRDTSPTGTLALKLAGTNALETKVVRLSLQGANDRTVYLSLEGTARKFPIGSYLLQRGDLAYGSTDQQEWEVSFSNGPQATLQADKQVEITLGEPGLVVRALREQDRYMTDVKPLTIFKQGSQIYLEPRIVGKGSEVLTQFKRTGNEWPPKAVPPSIRITGPDGRQVLSQKMEYG